MLVKHTLFEFSDGVSKAGNGSHCQIILPSLPRNLAFRKSEIYSDFCGIWSREDIPMGTRFGPYEDKKHILTNWLQYIKPARSEQQQNLAMFRCKEELFCISTHIPANTELLIGYKDESDCSRIDVSNSNIKLYEVSYVFVKQLELQYGGRHTEPDTCIKTAWCIKQLNMVDLFPCNSNNEYGEKHISTNSEIFRQAVTSEKFYKCDECSEEFTYDLDLEIHKRGHIQKKPHECETSAVTSKVNLKGFSDSLFQTHDGSYWRTSLHSLPKNLAIRQSIHNSDFYGIWSREDIQVGTRFGPYEKQVAKVINGKTQNDILCSWFQHIRPAYGEQQQNLVMFRCEEQIFCVSCIFIPANTELLVGYKEVRAYPWTSAVNNNVKLYEVSYDKIPNCCYKLKECDKCVKIVWKMRQLNIPDVFHSRSNHRRHNECDSKGVIKMPTQCHKAPHAEVRTYECHECGIKFRRNFHLNTHIRVHHCKECGKKLLVVKFKTIGRYRRMCPDCKMFYC